MEVRDKMIKQIVQLGTEKHPRAEIYLYGSRARGEADVTSDWGILVLLNQKEVLFSLETQIINDFYRIEIELGEAISPLVFSKQEWNTKYAHIPLHENIDTDAIRLK